jgi:3-deoxy-manno-octulosonate cytidylyltransferase (CMP-KDO synthetase)
VADVEAEIVVNVQADEPEVEPGNIDLAAKLLLDNPEYRMSTLVCRFDSAEQIANANMVKVVVDAKGRALYFSRCAVPFDRAANGIGSVGNYLRHIGIYGYRKDFLLKYAGMPASRLEQSEKLEQLRALENGFSILTGEVRHICEGIDTEAQYEAFVERYRKKAQNTS